LKLFSKNSIKFFDRYSDVNIQCLLKTELLHLFPSICVNLIESIRFNKILVPQLSQQDWKSIGNDIGISNTNQRIFLSVLKNNFLLTEISLHQLCLLIIAFLSISLKALLFSIETIAILLSSLFNILHQIAANRQYLIYLRHYEHYSKLLFCNSTIVHYRWNPLSIFFDREATRPTRRFAEIENPSFGLISRSRDLPARSIILVSDK